MPDTASKAQERSFISAGRKQRDRDRLNSRVKRKKKGKRYLYYLEVGMGNTRSGIGSCSCRWTPGINASRDWCSRVIRYGHHKVQGLAESSLTQRSRSLLRQVA